MRTASNSLSPLSLLFAHNYTRKHALRRQWMRDVREGPLAACPRPLLQTRTHTLRRQVETDVNATRSGLSLRPLQLALAPASYGLANLVQVWSRQPRPIVSIVWPSSSYGPANLFQVSFLPSPTSCRSLSFPSSPFLSLLSWSLPRPVGRSLIQLIIHLIHLAGRPTPSLLSPAGQILPFSLPPANSFPSRPANSFSCRSLVHLAGQLWHACSTITSSTGIGRLLPSPAL